MPDKFDLLVFDWDGTLADSTQAIVNAINCACQDANLPQPSRQASCDIIGLELKQAMHILFEDASEETVRQLAAGYHYHYDRLQEEVSLFTGVAEALQELTDAGHMIAVASGKGRKGLHHAIDTSGVAHLILTSRNADDCFSKPHPQMLHEIMDELGVAPERAVMVGDTLFDLQMANNAKIAGLGVTYGAQTLGSLLPHSPLATFDSFATLHAWLRTNA